MLGKFLCDFPVQSPVREDSLQPAMSQFETHDSGATYVVAVENKILVSGKAQGAGGFEVGYDVWGFFVGIEKG